MLDYFMNYYMDITHAGWVVNDILIAFCTVFLFNEIKYKSVKYWLLTAAKMIGSWLFVVLFQSLLYMLFGDAYGKQVVYPIYLVLYAVFFSKYKIKIRVINCLVFYSVIVNGMILSVVVWLLINMKFNITPIIMVVLSVSVTLYLKKFSMQKFKELPIHFFIVIMVISGISIALAFTFEFILLHVYDSFSYSIIMTTAMIAIISGVYFIFYNYAKEYNYSQYLFASSIKQEADRQMYEINEANYIEFRKMRHEVKNQYAYMKELLRIKDYEKLDEYFENVTSSFKEVVSYIDCGNKVINNIMNLAISKLKAANLEFEHQIVVPSELNISDSDLNSLFANLIDNAIEACARNDDDNDKLIEIMIRKQQSNLLIRVTNPFHLFEATEEYMELNTSKKDAKNHGFGVKIIKSIIAKYNGDFNYLVKNGRFIANVTLKITV